MSRVGTAEHRTRGSGWAQGGVTFAATVMILIGLFQAIQGIAAIVNDEIFVLDRG